jgi:hypothetical protein
MVPLAMGLSLFGWTLWRLFIDFPLMENVIPSRFILFTYLAAAVMLGVIIDHAHTAINRRHALAVDTPAGQAVKFRWLRGVPEAGAMAGVVLAALALVPIAAYYGRGVPLTTQPVLVPPWFRSVAPHLKGNQVLLIFPAPFSLQQSAMTWQAIDGMNYSIVGGGGPGGVLQRAGKERPGQTYIASVSTYGSEQGAVTPAEVTAVRRALDDWGVTTVVVPDTAQFPAYQQVRSASLAAVLMTAATGQGPVREAGAWVWTGLTHAGPPIVPSSGALAQCAPATRSVDNGVGAGAAAACVLARR